MSSRVGLSRFPRALYPSEVGRDARLIVKPDFSLDPARPLSQSSTRSRRAGLIGSLLDSLPYFGRTRLTATTGAAVFDVQMVKDLSLTHLVREPTARSAGKPPLLLLLHGVGSNEADLFGLAPYLDARFLVVSARAPVVMGYDAYGWFNIEFTPAGLVADVAQARASLRRLAVFLDELTDAYSADPRRVYLLGFSQGAMMSLGLTLSHPSKVAGVVAMSGRFPAELLAEARDADALAGLPVLVTHGTLDQVLPVANGRAVRDALSELPVTLTYREYPMAHEVSQESLRDVAAWLTRALAASEMAGTGEGR